MIRPLLCVLLTVALAAPSVHAQDDPQQIQSKVDQIVADADVTGLSAAYFENGQIQTTVATGYADREAERPVTESTVFSAASLSKPVLAYLVWQLTDEGTLDLDRLVADYYAYPDVAHDARANKVTIRQLLTHHGGLPNWREGDTLQFTQDPGAGFSYSGEGYVWLQRMLEHLTGKDYATLAREHVFVPLGMTRSSMVFEPAYEPDYARPYEDGQLSKAMHMWKEANAAASLQTTATDFARFLLAVLDRTDVLQQRVPVETAMWNDSPTPEPNTLGWTPGLGWQRTARGYQYWHWGHNNGFRAYFTLLPAENRGLVFFTNDSNGLDLVPALTDYAELGEQPGWRWAGYAPD